MLKTLTLTLKIKHGLLNFNTKVLMLQTLVLGVCMLVTVKLKHLVQLLQLMMISSVLVTKVQ